MTQNTVKPGGVFQALEGLFFVDSPDGNSLYKVLEKENHSFICSCPDYSKNSKNDPNYQCKHILAVLGTEHYSKLYPMSQGNGNGSRKPKLAEEFIKQIDGKDFVIYAGLLDLAHQKGLKNLEVEILQFPLKENDNLVICKATAISKDGESFIDYGDANPANCNPKVARHSIRMASTRAKARALRDFTNIGITCLEELGDLNEVIGEEQGNGNGKPRQPRTAAPQRASERPQSAPEHKLETPPKEPKQQRPVPAQSEKAPVTQPQKASASGTDKNASAAPPISEAQRRAILNLSKRRGIPEEQVNSMAQEQFGTPFDHLSSKDASQFIRTLQQAA